MAFTRQHYEQVAAILKNRSQDAGAKKVLQSIADDLSVMFALDNPNFNKKIFIKACGLQ